MPGELPAHASPALAPKRDQSYFLKNHETPSQITLDQDAQDSTAQLHNGRTAASRAALAAADTDSFHLHRDPTSTPPPALLSPAFTPPATPGTGTPALERDARSYAVDSDARAELSAPKLLPQLPKVECIVRARIPTTITGVEMFLHLYQNDMDNKEHLAIVFGDKVRSRSLDAIKPGETEMDRMIRGAYVGRLHPGRTSSRIESGNSSSGKASPMLQALQKPGGKSAAASARTSANLGETISQMLPASLTSSLKSDEEKAREQLRRESPLVRIHSECYTGETVWSARCDCGEQLDEAARLMSLPSASSAGGVIVYLRQEGRGIGLSEKLKAYNLQDLGSDTVEANLLLRHPADARSYGLATAILCDLGLGGEKGIRLLTNNPDKIRAVEGPNEEVVVKERVAMVPLSWTTGGAQGFNSPEVGQYLRTKIERMGHLLNMNS